MEQTYSLNNLMPPLWLMYPHISRYSIGWRMGYGEDYAYNFCQWYTSLSDIEQNKYENMFPEPKGWLGWYNDTHEDVYDNNILLWNKDCKLKYNLQRIQKDFSKGKKLKYIFFWGHQPSTDGKIIKSCMSQWWKSSFAIETDTYCCMEQYMMAEKARLFNDHKILDKILNNQNPKQVKELGRQVRGFDNTKWEKYSPSIILNGNLAKFLQDENLKQFLMETKDKILVEASPYDKIWGIGLSADHDNANNPVLWKGQNLLGFALMEVRDELIKICENENIIDYEKLHNQFD
ncbi:NADAR family protein [Vallitalea guaymasensis]|uniref:NADAR family protein n=1 Tax=Vallitalea guaymasensis TaxID=1185412 RepID=UPI000DE4E6FC|nr:NADAR family protein [Vallitalea guaymasensis]